MFFIIQFFFVEIIFLVVFLCFIVKKLWEYLSYKSSAYYQQTNVPFRIVRHDLGKYGEYLIYHRLKRYELAGCKFLFNVYIPKGESETTEIDVLMLSKKGLFVFESKNYSGWIYGKENQKNWTQVLPRFHGQSIKNCFYNPILQNESHITHLRNLIGEAIPVSSLVVFSERCTLRNMPVQSKVVQVINRNEVAVVVASIYNKPGPDYLSESDILHLFNFLYPYTQVSNEVKYQHIERIRKMENR